MGAGTGPLSAGDTYSVILTFNKQINTADQVYQCFESALWWVLKGLKGQISIDKTPSNSATTITGLKIKVAALTDDLDDVGATQFNRAMNRLLWGLRHRLHDGTAQRPGTDSDYNATITNENWLHEDT